MVREHRNIFAVEIITVHFGPLVAKVCECLLSHGALSLIEVIRFSELSKSTVKDCLLVLIQHSCVMSFTTERDRSRSGMVEKTVTLYMVIFDNIIHRMRFPRFLSVVKEDLGAEAVTLLEGLLQNGRLTFEHLVERTMSNAPKGKVPVRKDLLSTFNNLVRSHYVERCPVPDSFVDLGPSTSSRNRSKETVRQTSLQHQAMLTSTLSDLERFSEIPENVNGGRSSANDIDQKVGKGDKRKFEVLEKNQELNSIIAESEVLWRANYKKFLRCLKLKVCVQNVGVRFGPDAGIILEAILEASSEEHLNQVEVLADDVLQRLREKPGGLSITEEHFMRVRDQLNIYSPTEDSEAFCRIDLKSIIDACKNDEIESLIKVRFGEEATKIVRLLTLTTHPLHSDRVAEITLLTKSVANSIMYKLMTDGYIEMKQSLPERHFSWSVDKRAIEELVLDKLYHAVFNVNRRIAQVMKRFLEAPKNAPQSLKTERLILEHSLLKLDVSLMALHDFYERSV